MSELNRQSQIPQHPQEEDEDALERMLRAGAGTCPPPELVFAYSEDVLPDHETGIIRDHLTHCGVCNLLLADTAAMDEEKGLTPEQHARIAARFEAKSFGDAEVSKLSAAGWRRANLAVAAGLIVAVASAGVWLHGRRTSTVSVAVQPQQPSRSTNDAPADPLSELATVEPLTPPAARASDLLTRGAGDAGAGEPTATELMPAFRAYNRGDYATAVPAFRLVAERYPKASLPTLYLGVSQLELKDNAGAAATLRPLTASTNPSEDALWYAAVAEARLGNPAAAELFRRICAEGSTYPHAEPSCRLAAKLKP